MAGMREAPQRTRYRVAEAERDEERAALVASASKAQKAQAAVEAGWAVCEGSC